MIDVDGQRGGIAVYGSRGRVNDFFHIRFTSRFQQLEGPKNVHVGVMDRVFEGYGHRALRSLMEDHVRLKGRHDVNQGVRGNVRFPKLNAIRYVFPSSGRQVVHHVGLVSPIATRLGKVRTDKTRPSGD